MQFVSGPFETWRWPGRLVRTIATRRRLMKRGPEASHAVGLTFDDGPDPLHTPGVLDALRVAGASATFFVVGRQAALYPDHPVA